MANKIKTLEKDSKEYLSVDTNPFREMAAQIIDNLSEYLDAIGCKPSKTDLKENKAADIIYGADYYALEDDLTDFLYFNIYNREKYINVSNIYVVLMNKKLVPVIEKYLLKNKKSPYIKTKRPELLKLSINLHLLLSKYAKEPFKILRK